VPEIDEQAINRIFMEARTPKKWAAHEIEDATLMRLYDLVRMGPTSNNSGPARFVFVRGVRVRQSLLRAIHEGNRPKVTDASVIAIICYDVAFWRHWQTLSPHKDLGAIFGLTPDTAEDEARTSALLQAGYFILAARAVGLDAFPLTGFDPKLIEPELLSTGWEPIMLCCLGKGNISDIRPRQRRLAFETACKIL
jgi:3-hydroxypropanoate dehydrogenase